MRDAPGTILDGRYELLSRAGAGGMAVVWRARTLGAAGFTRPVAIKRIIEHLSRDPEFVAMFVEEARVVAHLAHPAVTQIHDFGVDHAGVHYLVMEWVEGVDLGVLGAHYAASGARSPWPLISAIAIEVLGALSAAHERRGPAGEPAPIFHRDVTPQNVLLSVDGYVKLTDFGIARAMDRATMTRPNALKGKISYVSPERLRNKPASERSDLFGVGVCLWEALAGRKLFDADTDMEVMFKVNEAAVPDLRGVRDDVPASLVEVLGHALARSPEDRYASTHEMGRALADVVRESGEPTDARRIASAVRAARAMDAAGLTEGTAAPTEVLEDLELLE